MREKSKTPLIIFGVLLIVAFFPIIIVLTIILVTSGGAAQSACGSTGAAYAVDPASVPKAAIAGYSGDQLVNAANIMLAAQKLRLTARDQQIGVMTAMGESSLQVLDRGDAVGPDSRGLFQQRANGAWGSYSDRMNPFISATNFFKIEKTIPDRENLEPTLVAHKVQRNADPYHYTKYWAAAGLIVRGLAGVKATAASAQQVTDSRYNLGAVQPQTAYAANVIGPKFNIETVGGYRNESTRDPEGHPAGLALDFMVANNPKGKSTGTALAEYSRDNATELGVKYIIWYEKIWSVERAAEGWRAMGDRGDDTGNHRDHVHVSFNGAAETPDCTENINLTASGWVRPATGSISDDYGPRTNPVSGKPSFHYGIDLAGGCDSPIVAATGGQVVTSRPDVVYGNLIEIQHANGMLTRYGHMFDNGVFVQAGDRVGAGQKIGAIGSNGWSTGCHLHFETKVDGDYVNPVELLAQVGVKIP